MSMEIAFKKITEVGQRAKTQKKSTSFSKSLVKREFSTRLNDFERRIELKELKLKYKRLVETILRMEQRMRASLVA